MNYEFFRTPAGGNQVLFLALCEVPFHLILSGGSLPSFGPPHMPMLVSTWLNAGGERPPDLWKFPLSSFSLSCLVL